MGSDVYDMYTKFHEHLFRPYRVVKFDTHTHTWHGDLMGLPLFFHNEFCYARTGTTLPFHMTKAKARSQELQEFTAAVSICNGRWERQ
jgi:hypothetical protein